MSLSRRHVITAAIAAPFVIGSRRASAFPSQPYSTTNADLTSAALAGLANGTWSADQISSGNHVNNLKFGGNLNADDVFSYSGGCYLPGQKKYMLPGTGGHSGSPNTGIATLDFPSLTWSITEPSSNYVTTGVADPGNPCNNSEKVFKSYPNIYGRRAPMAGHRYSIPVWMPEIGYGYGYGQWSYNTGLPNQGYYLFNSAGQWDQTKGFSTGATGGSYINTLTSLWVSSRKVLWVGSGTSGLLQSSEFDPLVGAVRHPCDFSHNAVYPDIGLQGPCVLIPDPNNPGDQAVVYWAYEHYSSAENIFYAPKVGSGATGQVSTKLAFGGAVPPGISVPYVSGSASHHNSSWFDFAGNYKSGSTKILVWDWNNASTGLYLLDTSTWTWAGPLSGSAFRFSWSSSLNGAYGFKCIFVMTDYVSRGSHLPIGLVEPGSDLTTTGGLYFYKIPWSAL